MGDIERIAPVAPEAQLISQVSKDPNKDFKRHQQDQKQEEKPSHDTIEINGEEAEVEEKKPENLENHLDIAA